MRGGILFGLVALLVSVFSIYNEGSVVATVATIPYLLLSLPLLLLFGDYVPALFSTVLILTIIYFIFGSFLGWVYGKIKNRKQILSL